MKFTEVKAQGAVANTVSANDLFLICSAPDTNPTSKVITFSSIANSVNQLGANQIPLMPNVTPANSGVTSTQGIAFYDSNYIYVAVANNLLKRVALSSF